MVDVTTPVPAGTPVGELVVGRFHGWSLLKDTAGVDGMGLVTASPAPYTLFGRLKAIADAIAAAFSSDIGVTRNIFAITPNATTAISPLPRVIRVDVAGTITFRAVDSTADVTLNVVAGERIEGRIQYIRVSGTTASGIVGFA